MNYETLKPDIQLAIDMHIVSEAYTCISGVKRY